MKPTIQAKAQQVKAAAERFASAQSFVVFEYSKMDAHQMTALRAAITRAGNTCSVLKQNILLRALKEAGKELPESALTGQVAVAFGVADAYQPIKAVHDAVKESKRSVFRAGVLEGKPLDAAGLAQVATLPSRDELYSMFLSVLQAPVRNFMYALKAVAETKGA